mmetsp:Transcript_11100/g.21303  ORF Transcript_11100/g.21303 Transcript_11100/m.21303 type:complete len:425 (+) Transcript_11100:46-1320(+)
MCLGAALAFWLLVSSALIQASVAFQSFGRRTLQMSSSFGNDNVVICGGGIHGASLAYYLTLKGIKPTIIERTSVAAAASGKAGGFLARGWGDGGITEALHHTGYDLHQELAETLDIQSYRKLPTLSVNGGRKGKNPASWLDGKASSSIMDTNTAQVTPLELTEKLMAKAIERGASVRIGTVEGMQAEETEDGSSSVTGVIVDGETVACDKVVVTMGPWSVRAEEWFGMTVPIEGIKSTSVVYKDCQPVVEEPFACFCAEDTNGCHLEIYPRPNGEVYICGIGGSDYVRGDRLKEGGDCQDAGLIGPDPARVQAAARSFGGLSTSLGGSKGPDVVQACMRPCPSDGLPMMGPVPGFANAFMSAGHNCWGILWAPVSGLAMAELVAEGQARVVDLAPFNPGRFTARKRGAGKRGRHNQSTSVGEQW